ncbi:MAG: hypothetical protein KDI75_05825 [Xanthomonadales bacterium]|nr:hypothetical protein [Xanthomonadales bacterium]
MKAVKLSILGTMFALVALAYSTTADARIYCKMCSTHQVCKDFVIVTWCTDVEDCTEISCP